MKKLALLVCLAAVGITANAPADAKRTKAPSQQSLVARYYNDPYYGYQNGRVCPRWCREDRNPCDPPSFKAADGRCNWLNR